MTAATTGLIIGGIIAGPVAQYAITRYKLRSQLATEDAEEKAETVPLRSVDVVGALAGIFVAVVAGQWLAARFSDGAITLPAFLWCMMIGVAIRNLLPFTGVRCNDRAAELISSVCLSLFLVMTMMALDLIEVALSAGPLVVIVAMQAVAIVFYAIWVCFRCMGRDYEAAVTSAAFIGFCMGSTATAMANMQAITAKYGPAPQSFLIVPLAGAFFIDLMNAFLLTLMLALPFMGA